MAIRLNGVDKRSTVHDKNSIPHGTYHFMDNPNLYEIQRTNCFEFVVTGLDGLLKAGMLGTERDARVVNAQETLRMAVSSAFIPHFEQQPISIKRGNSEIKYAGTATYSGGDLQFHDFIGLDTKQALMAWQNESYDARTEKVGLVADYKKTCYLIEYTPDWQKVRQWILYGCWISNLTEDPYNSDADADKHSISATIQYDKAVLDTSEVI